MKQKPITQFPNAPDLESSTQEYATRFSGKIGAWFLNRQSEATQSLLKGDNLNILDVGGAHGQNIETLRRLGHRITIFSSEGCSTSLIDNALADNLIEYHTGDLLKLPFEDNSYDVVISYRTMSHMENWPEFIAEMSRVAKSRVIIDYPTVYSFNIFYRILFRAKRRIEKNTREFNTFTTKSIAQCFKRNGFELESKFRQFFLPMALHRLFGNPVVSTVTETIFAFVGLTELFGSPLITSFRSDAT